MEILEFHSGRPNPKYRAAVEQFTAILSLALWMALGGAWNLALATLGALAVTLLFGEVLPKTLAVRAPELWSLRVAKPMAWLQTLSAPLRRRVRGCTCHSRG